MCRMACVYPTETGTHVQTDLSIDFYIILWVSAQSGPYKTPKVVVGTPPKGCPPFFGNRAPYYPRGLQSQAPTRGSMLGRGVNSDICKAMGFFNVTFRVFLTLKSPKSSSLRTACRGCDAGKFAFACICRPPPPPPVLSLFAFPNNIDYYWYLVVASQSVILRKRDFRARHTLWFPNWQLRIRTARKRPSSCRPFTSALEGLGFKVQCS